MSSEGRVYTVEGGGVGRCLSCQATDWVSNFEHQGCSICGYPEETCVLQVWNEGERRWVDYGRGTTAQVRREVNASTYGPLSRGVDWINKEEVTVPPPKSDFPD